MYPGCRTWISVHLFSKELVEPISLTRFSYNSIPNCFAPVAMETLNQTGILPVQNYPALQLKGKGVLIGFLDSGIDYQNKVSAIWTVPRELRHFGIRLSKAELHPETFSTEVNTVRKRLIWHFLLIPHYHRSLLSISTDMELILPVSLPEMLTLTNSFWEPLRNLLSLLSN